MDDIVLKRKADYDLLNSIDKRTELIQTTLTLKTDALSKDIRDVKDKIKDYIEVKTDVTWLKKFFWTVATASLTAIVISIFAVIVKRNG